MKEPENNIQKFQEELLADKGYQFHRMTEDGKAIWARDSFIQHNWGVPAFTMYASVDSNGVVDHKWKEEFKWKEE